MVSSNLRQTNKKISSRLDKLEKSIAQKLNAFYNQKIKPNATIFPIEVLRQRHDAEVKTIIRKAVQDSYLEGTDLVGQKIQEKVQDFLLFISVTDINNIQAITNDMADKFWTKAGKLVARENEFVVEQDELKPKPSFDAKAAMLGLAVSITFLTFSNAVKSKLPAAITQPLPTFANANLELNTDIGFDIHELKGRVRFTTKHDSKVDPQICAPLDGTEWDAGDPDIVVPIEMTHDWCRCKLIPIVE